MSVACADSGYASTGEMEKIAQQEIKVVVPSHRQASQKKPSPFAKERFSYDTTTDCYICPEGHKLLFSHFNQKSNTYLIPDKNICLACTHYGTCTSSK